jgi:hypothetical protein
MFDIRMSQQIRFVLKAKHLICVMKESLNALEYFYNFKLLVLSLGPLNLNRKQDVEALSQQSAGTLRRSETSQNH